MMWSAIGNWSARRRRTRTRFLEVYRCYDAWPETCALIYALCSLPVLVSLLGRRVPIVFDFAISLLGMPIVWILTVMWRRRYRLPAGGGAGVGFDPHLFEFMAVLTCAFMLIPTAEVVRRQHGPLAILAVWCAAIALWLFAVNCLATFFTLVYRLIRSL